MEEENKPDKESSPIQDDKVRKPLSAKLIIAIAIIIIIIAGVVIASVYIGINIGKQINNDDDEKNEKSDNTSTSNTVSNVVENTYYDDYYSYFDDYDDYDLEEFSDEELETFEKNLTFEKIGVTENNEFVFSIKNNNDVAVEIDDVYVIFKDEDGNFIDKTSCTTSYFAVGANSKIIMYTYDGTDFYANSQYEFKVELATYHDDYVTIDNFDIKPNNNGYNVALEVVNNNDFTISDFEFVIVYYKDGKVVGTNNTYESSITEPSESAYISLDYAYDSDYNEITDFDDYEVYLIFAYIYE